MEKGILRPPIVTVLGHVDHGKTSLLDKIRGTFITKHEAGGITQSIGASVTNGITFVDTPGHALFSAMRARGVNIADIVILVVAADDGASSQTKEVIKMLQESKTPFVVAITKIDLPTANVENALQSLEKEGVYFEKRGGEVPYVTVSSKTGEGIKELLDLINLVAEVIGIEGSSSSPLDGYVIETAKDKRGLLVSVVVKNGHIGVSDTIFTGSKPTKIKGLFDSLGKAIREVGPGLPVQILGFDELPQVGVKVSSQEDIKSTKAVNDRKMDRKDAKVKIFLKAKTLGGLEALLANIPDGVGVIGSSVGDLTESDIFLAKASLADIFLFEAKYSNQIKKLAEMEGIAIYKFDVVYDMIDTLTERIKKGEEKITGRAQIVASFPFDNRHVAGCKILDGVIRKSEGLKLIRNEKEIGKVKILSIRKQKNEVNEVKQGEECGILFVPQLDFQAGDVLLSVVQ